MMPVPVSNQLDNTGAVVVPRFEFRSFGQDFDKAAKRMARLSAPVPEQLWERVSDELYIVSRLSDTCNAKIRGHKIEMKKLVQRIDGLEQWKPVCDHGLPLDAAMLNKCLFPSLDVPPPDLCDDSYDLEKLLALIRSQQYLLAVHVHKQRFAYQVNDTICETGNILVNGARIMTISTESASAEQVKQTILALGLENTENINYVQAIKRVTGMIDKPLAN